MYKVGKTRIQAVIRFPDNEEPYEGRLSRTVPLERGGEIPLRDPII